MSNIEEIKYAGYFTVELFDEYGNLKAIREGKNLITNDGKGWLIAHTFDSATTCINFISIGSTASGGTAVVTDSAAATGLTKADKTAIVYAVGGTKGWGSGTATFSTAVAATNTGITEVGLWARGSNATGSGILFARQLFTSVDKTGQDKLSITWDVRFS